MSFSIAPATQIALSVHRFVGRLTRLFRQPTRRAAEPLGHTSSDKANSWDDIIIIIVTSRVLETCVFVGQFRVEMINHGKIQKAVIATTTSRLSIK